MKLKSLNKTLSLLFFFVLCLPIKAEEQIDIWNKTNKDSKKEIQDTKNTSDIKNPNILNTATINNNIEIENNISDSSENSKIFGIYEPAKNNFDLNMWSRTDAEKVRSSFKRINKIKLSNTASQLFESTILSIAHPPKGMDDNEFIDLKINWLIENKKIELIEKFLNYNKTFPNKKKMIQYLVDSNIANTDIKSGCEKTSFLDKNIKDSYLDKFKIYCLVFNNKNNEAQLQLDILREENQSDNFFDDKINFLLGVTNKTSNKINEKNLLNFYLSSVTIKDFKFEPKKNTKKIIWDYLNA